MLRLLPFLLLASFPASAENKVDCEKLDITATDAGTLIPGYMAVYEVVGTGRAPFYSAPDQRCAMPGVFLIPKDRVTAYRDYDGYLSVMYLKRTGGDVIGWIKADRLHATGEGIAPRQDVDE